jgi:hypothetical protein
MLAVDLVDPHRQVFRPLQCGAPPNVILKNEDLPDAYLKF